MTDYCAYAAEYDDSHDRIDDEQEILKGMFDRLRADVRKEFSDKKDAQAKLAEFKALLVARRKFGPRLEGYADKSERIQILNDEIFGRNSPLAPNKRTSIHPIAIARPSSDSLARARDNSNPAPVSTPPDIPDRDGAEAESQASPSPEGASATKFVSLEAAAGDNSARSPDLNKEEGRNTALHSAPAAAVRGAGGSAAAIASPESEPAGSKAPIRCGGADPDREAGLHAGSPPLSSDPLDIRNTPMWRG